MTTAAPYAIRVELGRRERDVLSLLASGFTYAETSRELAISYSTVKTHASSVIAKLGARNTANAAAIAVSLGEITLQPYRAGAS